MVSRVKPRLRYFKFMYQDYGYRNNIIADYLVHDHNWGVIYFQGKAVATIDFWSQETNPWRPGKDGFGWPDEFEPRLNPI